MEVLKFVEYVVNLLVNLVAPCFVHVPVPVPVLVCHLFLIIAGNMKDKTDSNTEQYPDDGEQEHEPTFVPIIYLPEIVVNPLDDDETVLYQQRAKLFRHDNEENIWKERGIGDIKILHNEESNTVRIVMRREKVFKVCANHLITVDMEMTPSCGSDRAFVWTTNADFADVDPTSEIFAVKFLKTDFADQWKKKFNEAKEILKVKERKNITNEVESTEINKKEKDLVEGVEQLSVTDEKNPKSHENDGLDEPPVKPCK